jgi:hypothetical protein
LGAYAQAVDKYTFSLKEAILRVIKIKKPTRWGRPIGFEEERVFVIRLKDKATLAPKCKIN